MLLGKVKMKPMLKVRPLGANEWLPYRPGCARYRALVAAAYGVWPVEIPEGYEILGYGHGQEGATCHYAGANKIKVEKNSYHVHQIEGPLPYGIAGKWVPRMLVRPLAQEPNLDACQAGPGLGNWATQDWSLEAAKAMQNPGTIVPVKAKGPLRYGPSSGPGD